MNVMEPVNLLLSVPPQVISPFKSLPVMEGSKETPISWAEMAPWENKLSVTVGMVLEVAGDKVSSVRSTGPILIAEEIRTKIETIFTDYTHPMIPSTPSNPSDWR